MRGGLRLLSILGLSGMFFSGTVWSLSGETQTSAKKGTSFYTQMTFSLDGKKMYTLGDWQNIRKKHTLVIMWATFCGPCKRELPSVLRLSKTMARELDVLSICIERPVPGGFSVPGLPFYYSNNISKLALAEFNVDVIPVAFLFDPSGRMIRKHIGAREWDSSESIRELRADMSQFGKKSRTGKR